MTRTSTHFPVRRTAHDREERRIRIMGMVRAGLSYEAIAREVDLSRERIRQIVTQSLHAEDGATRVDANRLQMARLEPALRLAARGIENGKLQAIGALLKVLERLDKYGAVVGMDASETEGSRERLLKKLDAVAARMGIPYPAAAENLAAAKMGWTDL
jgi:hypothetical protein